MRTFISGAGVDVTPAVVAYLKSAAAQQAAFANLILIGEPEDERAVFLTDWETDLAWPVWGTFVHASVELGQVTSAIGLVVNSLDLPWSPPVGVFTNDIATTSPYQLARIGFYDNKIVRVWRTIMPTPGDANTYGACEWFGGWVSGATTARNQINFKVDSFLNVTKQKIPANLLEGTSALAGFLAGAPVLADAETSVPTFAVVAPSNATVILGSCLQPTGGKIYGTRKLALGYLVFKTGSLKGAYSIVAVNSNYNAGGGVHYNQFQVYTPFPWDPAPGDTFYVTTAPPVTSNDSTGGPYVYRGFPYLPDPEDNL